MNNLTNQNNDISYAAREAFFAGLKLAAFNQKKHLSIKEQIEEQIAAAQLIYYGAPVIGYAFASAVSFLFGPPPQPRHYVVRLNQH
jgi:hypothetical protein